MSTARSCILAMLASVTMLAACGMEPEQGEAALSSAGSIMETARGPAPDPAPTPTPSPSREVDNETGSAYEAMCAHYCGTLEKTLVYSCLLGGADPASCEQMWRGHAGRCYELRCLSGRADVAVCLLQCDALKNHYGPYCAVDDPARQPLCPLSAEEQNRTCRAACSLSPEPPVEAQAPASRS